MVRGIERAREMEAVTLRRMSAAAVGVGCVAVWNSHCILPPLPCCSPRTMSTLLLLQDALLSRFAGSFPGAPPHVAAASIRGEATRPRAVGTRVEAGGWGPSAQKRSGAALGYSVDRRS